MRSPVLGEFMGTMMLVLLGDGVVAGVLLKRSKAEDSGWMVITTAWAFAVLCGIFTALLFGSPDAHLNPAITLAFSISNHDFTKFLPCGSTISRIGRSPKILRSSAASSALRRPSGIIQPIYSRSAWLPSCSYWWRVP
jgi:Major intrinsic protein